MSVDPTPAGVVPLIDPTLILAAASLDGTESLRIASENRLRQATTTEPDEDGVLRGLGLDVSHPFVATQTAMVATLKGLEHDATLTLQRAMRKHPLGPWVKATVGVGEKQAARLLAAIGDPSWNASTGSFRTVGQLHAYCGLHVVDAPAPTTGPAPNESPTRILGSGAGTPTVVTGIPFSFGAHDAGDAGDDSPHTSSDGHAVVDAQVNAAVGGTNFPASHVHVDTRGCSAGGDTTVGDPDPLSSDTHAEVVGVAPRRKRGQRANWSTDAKTRAYLIATSCIKHQTSPYRPVYDARRQHTALTHPEWTDGHSHNDALRIVSKALLRDLYREAKRIHTGDPDHGKYVPPPVDVEDPGEPEQEAA